MQDMIMFTETCLLPRGSEALKNYPRSLLWCCNDL